MVEVALEAEVVIVVGFISKSFLFTLILFRSKSLV